MRDLFHSIRGRFNRCEYFTRDERDSVGDLSQWILNKIPRGVFYAKPITTRTNEAGQVVNVFMYNKNEVMIETEDETPELERGCIVSYKKSVWIVDDVQRAPHIKETEFSQEDHVTTIIRLRR